MSTGSTTTSGGGIVLLGAVFIVFLVLKLTGQIDWSWWAVTLPLWMPWLVLLAVGAVVGAVLTIVKAVRR